MLPLLLLCALTVDGFSQSGAAAVRPGYLFLTPVSGTYNQDQLLAVEPAEPHVLVRYSFRDPDGAEGPWIPFRESLSLSAAAGEEREYRVLVRADRDGTELERRELWLRIDKRPPAPPRIVPDSATTWEPVQARFESGKGDRVSYSVRGDISRSPIAWDGAAVSLGLAGSRTEQVIQAYSVDAAGNRSRIVEARYVVDARESQIEVLSPVPGTFANAQVLALAFRNVQWVRYTVDGSDPATAGIPYVGPVSLAKQPTVTVRVAAQPRAASRPMLRREVTFTYAPETGNGLLLDTESGSYQRSIAPRILSAPSGSVYATLWEKTPQESDSLVTAAVQLPAIEAANRAVTLRLRRMADDGGWGAEYRYFYFVGAAVPAAPTVSLADPEPLRASSRCQILAPEDSLFAVTIDGTTPVPGAAAGSATISLSPSTATARIVLQCIAWDGSGARSAVTERSIAVDTAPGGAPVVSASRSGAPGSASIAVSGSAASGFVYEITSDGSEPSQPTADSPRIVPPLLLSIPYGVERSFRLRVAALDSAGRSLASSPVFATTLSLRPPSRPVLNPAPNAAAFDEPAVIAVSSTGKVIATLSSDGTNPRDPATDAPPLGGQLQLPGVSGALTTYRLKLIAVSDAGLSTEVYGPYRYTVDLRVPTIPAVAGIEDGGRYSQRSISPIIGEVPWQIRYTATSDGSVPPDPTKESPLFTNATTFQGDDGNVKVFKIKLFAVSRAGTREGERRALGFTIDLKPPDVPQLSGIRNGARSPAQVAVSAEGLAADERVFLSSATGAEDPPDPVESGIVLKGTVPFDVPDGERRDFTIRLAAVDAAGNRSQYDRRYRFTIDRELPDDPDVSGAPANGISNRPVTISIASREAVVTYELSEDGSMPRLPTEKSTAYSSPILLAGKAGAAVTYRLVARAWNDLGNASRALRVVSLIVDRTLPAQPPEPRISFSEGSPGVAYLAWDLPATGRILYRLKNAAGAAGAYAGYLGPVAVDIESATLVSGDAVAENAAGTQSAPSGFSKPVSRKLASPVLRGIREGQISTTRIEVKLDAQQGQLRYEAATDGDFPPTVTGASPIVPAVLSFDAAEGETLGVRLAVRAFDTAGSALPSDEVRVGFTIDRTPPDPPFAAGIVDGGYYQDSRAVDLLSSEGAIYYALAAGAEAPIPARTEATRYRQQISLEAKQGETIDYHITAYSVDDAGNRSRQVQVWNVTIDQKIVYATPSGNDYADGARATPVRSLARALSLAAASSRKTVFLAGGQYPVDSQLTIDSDVTVVGGLDESEWTPLGLERFSVISAAAPWRTGSSVIAINGGRVTLRGVEVRDDTHGLARLLSVWAGEVLLEKSLLTLNDADTGQAIFLRGGTLTVSSCTLSAAGVQRGSLLGATGGSLKVMGTSFQGPASSLDFSCIDLSDIRGVAFQGLTVLPGAGQRTRGIRAVRTQLAVSGGSIQSGAGTLEAVAIDARESVLSIERSTVVSTAAARSPTAILSSSSTTSVSQCRITVAGSASAVGISARAGELVFVRNIVEAAATLQYLSLIRVEDCTAVIANNLMLGADAGESVCLIARDGAVDVLNNTVVVGTGATLTAGILVQGDRVPRIVNNVLVHDGADRGWAIAALGARALLATPAAAPGILTNSFSGWGQLLRVEYVPEAARAPLVVKDLDTLHALDGDRFGGSVQGNLIEAPRVTFAAPARGDYQVAAGSKAINSGTDLAGLSPLKVRVELSPDIDGKPRPGPDLGDRTGPPRGWDIGAYEF